MACVCCASTTSWAERARLHPTKAALTVPSSLSCRFCGVVSARQCRTNVRRSMLRSFVTTRRFTNVLICTAFCCTHLHTCLISPRRLRRSTSAAATFCRTPATRLRYLTSWVSHRNRYTTGFSHPTTAEPVFCGNPPLRRSTTKQTNVQTQKKEPHKATPSYFFGAAPRVKTTSGVPPEPQKGVYGGGRLRSPNGVHVATAPNGGVSLWGYAPIPQVIRQIAECYSPLGDSLLRGGSCSSTIPLRGC